MNNKNGQETVAIIGGGGGGLYTLVDLGRLGIKPRICDTNAAILADGLGRHRDLPAIPGARAGPQRAFQPGRADGYLRLGRDSLPHPYATCPGERRRS